MTLCKPSFGQTIDSGKSHVLAGSDVDLGELQFRVPGVSVIESQNRIGIDDTIWVILGNSIEGCKGSTDSTSCINPEIGGERELMVVAQRVVFEIDFHQT